MANDITFGHRLAKISLIILNSLVIIGLSFGILLIGQHFDSIIIVFILLVESNFVLGVIGAVIESRPLLMTTGSVTLILLLLAIFSRTERSQNSTFSLLYFLSIVLLSFAFSAMIREKQQNQLRARVQTTVQSSQPFTTVVVYQSPTPQMTVNIPFVMNPTNASSGEGMANSGKDLPPPYEDCPPPKYEEVVNTQT